MSTRSSAKQWALDFGLSFLAVGGLAAAVTAGVSVRANSNAFSDLKTVYASARCFAYGQDAYSLANLQTVFALQHVIEPASWFGHYPVYPPTTLALLAPFSLLPMAVAVYCITFLSALAFSAAVASLLEKRMDQVDTTWGWKAVFVTLCASGPLLGFAFVIGNLSVLATALAVLAFTSVNQRRLWLPACSLAVAVLVKPHVAIWIGIAMLLLRKGPRCAVALRAAGLVAGFTGVLAVALSICGKLTTQMTSFWAILTSESSSGSSLNISSHAVVPAEAQITSLQSLLGFWSHHDEAIFLTAATMLILAGGWLAQTTRRAETEEQAMLTGAAWVTFGCLATYHRAYDAIALLLLLPFLMSRLRRTPGDTRSWAIAGLYVTMSFGPSVEFIRRELIHVPEYSLLTFVTLRQMSIASVCMLIALCLTLHMELARNPQLIYRTLRLKISPKQSREASHYSVRK